jgi:hypothetical protein
VAPPSPLCFGQETFQSQHIGNLQEAPVYYSPEQPSFYHHHHLKQQKPSPPSVFDREDKFIASKKSGFHWVEHEDYGPEAEAEDRPKQIGHTRPQI